MTQAYHDLGKCPSCNAQLWYRKTGEPKGRPQLRYYVCGCGHFLEVYAAPGEIVDIKQEVNR
ncbi:hypothetical protein NITHO_4880009 [Nitrolancea hollandica Lb]|uniref:Uncharacterized protein n=1 Tax=Nitrolancea hollandica Lb TaxID=1129897 RepID=I4EL02_9BACT|nr:hypothetical protein NITHO_4880009 [Nitrolancea hollandica Lb]